MKKTFFARLALLLAISMLLVSMIGCGDKPENSDPTSNDANGITTTTADNSDEPSDNGSATTTGTAGSDMNPDNITTDNIVATTGSNVVGGFTTTMPTTRPTKFESTVGKVDLKGYEFVIATNDIPVAGKSDYYDAVLARNAQVEKELNCKIRYEYFYNVTAFDDMSPLLMAGDKVADLVLTTMHNMGRFINAQFLYDINDLKEIKQSSYCYDQIGFTNTTLKSGTYGILGSAIRWKIGGCIVYNKRLVKQMGLTDPVDHVKKNTWNWDTFKTMVSKAMKDLDNDGSFTPADQWAVTGDRYDGICGFFNGSGNSMLTMQNKQITYTLDSKKGLDALAAMKSIFAIPGGIYNPDMILDTNSKQFTDGKAVFWLGALNWYHTLSSNMNDDIGIVPMPKGNNATDYVAAVTHNSPIGMVPITIDDPTKTATVIQRLFEVAYEKDEESVYFSQFTNSFQDEACHEMFKKHIAPATYFDVAMLYKAMSTNTYNATECVVGNPIILNQEAYVAAEMIESYKDTCTKFLKVLNGK